MLTSLLDPQEVESTLSAVPLTPINFGSLISFGLMVKKVSVGRRLTNKTGGDCYPRNPNEN